jgi:uncharacterized membrane protein YgcG
MLTLNLKKRNPNPNLPISPSQAAERILGISVTEWAALTINEANNIIDAARTPNIHTAIVKKIAGKGTMGPMLLNEAILDHTPTAQRGGGTEARHIRTNGNNVRNIAAAAPAAAEFPPDTRDLNIAYIQLHTNLTEVQASSLLAEGYDVDFIVSTIQEGGDFSTFGLDEFENSNAASNSGGSSNGGGSSTSNFHIGGGGSTGGGSSSGGNAAAASSKPVPRSSAAGKRPAGTTEYYGRKAKAPRSEETNDDGLIDDSNTYNDTDFLDDQPIIEVFDLTG